MPSRPQLKYTVILLTVSVIFATVLFRVMIPVTSTGTTSSLQQQVLSIASDLRAPDDHNTMTVANSSLPTAQAMRYQIQQYILQGKSKEAIIHLLEKKYGDEILATPSFSGFGSTVWMIPALFIVICITILIFLCRKIVSQKSVGSVSPENSHEADDMVSKIEATLQDYL